MRDDAARNFFIALAAIGFVAALWFVWKDEPIQHTQAESEIVIIGVNVTNVEWMKLKEEQDKRTKEKLEATAEILEAVGSALEALGDMD